MMIILNNRSKVPDDLPPPSPPFPLVHFSSLEVDMDQSEVCLVYSVRWLDGNGGRQPSTAIAHPTFCSKAAYSAMLFPSLIFFVKQSNFRCQKQGRHLGFIIS